MEPRYPSGSIIIVMPEQRPRNGCLVVAKLKNDGVIFRRFSVLSGKKPLFHLTPYNDVYPALDGDEDDFHWIHPVWSVTEQAW